MLYNFEACCSKHVIWIFNFILVPLLDSGHCVCYVFFLLSMYSTYRHLVRFSINWQWIITWRFSSFVRRKEFFLDVLHKFSEDLYCTAFLKRTLQLSVHSTHLRHVIELRGCQSSSRGLYRYTNRGEESSTQIRTRDIIVLSATFCCDGTQFPAGYLRSVRFARLGQ